MALDLTGACTTDVLSQGLEVGLYSQEGQLLSRGGVKFH